MTATCSLRWPEIRPARAGRGLSHPPRGAGLSGVLQDQKAGRRRTRSLALASILLVVLAMGPFVWRVTDEMIDGEHWSDMATQVSLWICIFFPALLAAALVAGWMRNRSDSTNPALNTIGTHLNATSVSLVRPFKKG